MIIAGNGIYERCCDCGGLVKINKFMFGGLHVCVSAEQRAWNEYQRQEGRRLLHNQMNSTFPTPLGQSGLSPHKGE